MKQESDRRLAPCKYCGGRSFYYDYIAGRWLCRACFPEFDARPDIPRPPLPGRAATPTTTTTAPVTPVTER